MEFHLASVCVILLFLSRQSSTCLSRSSPPKEPNDVAIELDKSPPKSVMETGECEDLIALYKVHLADSQSSIGNCRSDLFSNCPIRTYRYRMEGTHTIATGLHASITRADCTHHEFRNSTFIDRQMRAMGASNNDLRGHLIASEFCGPSEWFNLAPFSPLLKAKIDDEMDLSWSEMEHSWKRRMNRDGEKIDVYIFIDYIHEDSESQAVRKLKGFRVCTQYVRGYASIVGEDDWYFQN